MNKEVLAVEETIQVDELCEDIEVVGPGSILSEARKKLSLSTAEVSRRLNFKKNLVNEIEQDIFDPLLPATFNRGYLRTYAHLVGVDVDEVLSAYDVLGVAEVQRSEMQSFSNLTVKQAEHSRLMWFSYLIVAFLFGLMVIWWLQEPKLSVDFFDEPNQTQSISNSNNDIADENKAKVIIELPTSTKLAKVEAIKSNEITETASRLQKGVELVIPEQDLNLPPENLAETNVKANTEIKTELDAELSTVVFTFSGDCWVNIYDATGDRIAWGVKKLGYVMTVTGKAPLKVTLGKPELAEIAFNGQQVDLSSFNVGNIAKFTLPLISQ